MTPAQIENRKAYKRQYARDHRAGKKRMCPQCGVNELDKHKQLCSECAVVNRQITVDKAQHTYFNKPEVKAARKIYLKERYERLKREATIEKNI